MKKDNFPLEIVILAFVLFCLGILLGFLSDRDYKTKPRSETIIIKVDRGNVDSVKWQKLINAITAVESEGNDSAYNKSGAVGTLQIMPIMVKDANRILGEEKYSLSDRYKRDTSIEMFNVIQDHYNPTHDISKAIKLHNPRAGKWYYNRVMKELKKQEI